MPKSTSIRNRSAQRQGFLARAFDDTSNARYQNASARQRLSITQATLSGLLVIVPHMVATWHSANPVIPSWLVIVSLGVLFIPWMLVTGMLNASVFGIFDLRDRELDEAERHQRDSAYRSAYRIVIGLSMITLGALAGNTAHATLFIMGFLMIVIVLPVHIAAWRMRGDARESDTHDEGPARGS